MSFFSSDDARILNTLIYQPSLKPGYEMVKNMLTWKDEWPVAISADGMEKLFDLWIARSYVYDDRPFSSHVFGGKHLEAAWSNARGEIPNWPGFQRLKLSAEDRRYLDDERRALEEEDDY
jgi:hypothetical protein